MTAPAPVDPVTDAPILAALAADRPDTWAQLLHGWANPDPAADLVELPAAPARDYDPLVLPDAPSVDRGRPLRQYRGAALLFDEQVTAEQVEADLQAELVEWRRAG